MRILPNNHIEVYVEIEDPPLNGYPRRRYFALARIPISEIQFVIGTQLVTMKPLTLDTITSTPTNPTTTYKINRRDAKLILKYLYNNKPNPLLFK